MTRCLILFILMIPLASAHAGTLCGQVTDEVSGGPVFQAGVLVHQDGAYTGLHASTNVFGHFCIDLPAGTYRLEIRVDDYLIGWRDGVVVEDDLTEVQVPMAVPAVLLGAPWPNPTAGAAKIRVTVNRSADVELSVYDTRGRLLRRWSSPDVQPGALEHVWDGLDAEGRRATDGLYLIQARAEGRGVSRPLMLVH